MKSKITYHEQTDMENTLKLREVLKTLPSFTSEFFRGINLLEGDAAFPTGRQREAQHAL